MRNFGDAQAAVETALNSNNSAIEENARYMESITAKLNALKSEYQKFILGDGGLEAFEKKMLDIAIALTEFINKIGGLSTVLSTLGTILAVAIVPNMLKTAKSFGDLIGIIPALINHFQYAQKTGVTFTAALSELTVGLNITQLAIQGIVAAIGIAITAYNIWKQQQEELAETAHESAVSTLEQNTSIEAQIKSLQKENQSREDLIKAIQAVDSAYKDEGQSLDEINRKRQETIDKLKEEGEQALKNAKESGYSQYKKDLTTLNKSYAPNKQTEIEASYYGVTINSDGLKNYIDSLKALREEENKANADTSHLNKLINELEDNYNNAKNGVDNYNQILYAQNEKYNDVIGKIVSLNAFEQQEKDIKESNTVATEEQKGVLEDLGYSLEELENILNESDYDKLQDLLVIQDIDGVIGLLQSYGLEINGISDVTNEASDAVANFINTADDLQSAYETLNKAADEYNKNGYISAATLKKLAKLDSEYQAQLEITNGTMTVTNGALQDQFNLSKQLAVIHAKTETETEALAYAEGYLAQNVNQVKTDSSQAQPKVSALSQAFTDLGHATQEANKGIWAVRNALGDDTSERKAFEEGLNAIYERGKKRVETLENIELEYVSSSKSNADSHKDTWVEAFEEEQRLLKHSLEMNEITEIEYYEKLKDLNEKYFGEVSGNHKKYLKEYQENEEEIYKGLKSIYDKVRDYLKEAVEQGYEKAINAIKKEEKALLAEIKSQIEALKKEKKHVLDGIKDEVNALKRQKEEAQKYYNDQIDALKRENEEIEQQNELLEYQQALQQAKSKKVMVFQEGKFQLTEDESAVAQAEQNLAQYQNKAAYEKQIQELEDLRDATVESIEERIQALEDYYDYMEDYYDRRIDSMEEYYNEVQNQYEKQIEALQEQLDAFKEGYQKQEDLENARLAAQVLGINERSLLYEQDLENLKNYINSTNKMLESLGEAGVTVSSDYKGVQVSTQGVSKIGSVDSTVKRRAKGDASFSGDEIALVGESPNAEIVLGSHLNHSLGGGSLMNLAKGSGVVNAESTATLAGLLNGLANPTSVSNSRTTQQNFSFGSITLPNVTDANSFVKTLSTQFNNYAIQYGNVRK